MTEHVDQTDQTDTGDRVKEIADRVEELSRRDEVLCGAHDELQAQMVDKLAKVGNQQRARETQEQERVEMRQIAATSGSALVRADDHRGQRQLEQIDDKHQRLIKWLMLRFEEGVHYGIPPGVRITNEDSKRWRQKPMLYEAGALRVMTIFELRQELAIDRELLEVLQLEAGGVAYKCELYSTDGVLVSTGQGVYEKDENASNKGRMKAHARVQVAQKRAMVDAVHNGFPALGELFTRDLAEDNTREEEVARDDEDKPPTSDQLARVCSLIQDNRLPRNFRDRLLELCKTTPLPSRKEIGDALLRCKQKACGGAKEYARTKDSHAPPAHERLTDDGLCTICGLDPNSAGVPW